MDSFAHNVELENISEADVEGCGNDRKGDGVLDGAA